ncbi:alpha/beta fold hydrolase [Kocuria rhizosphaericola]|uniref:alpha/beta fold hydrolase n=1 Tax=Kocuria rhizosphaericola TaxID=3376284 RepID=UPI0037A72788
MSSQRTHYVTTTDDVTIGGAVHGEGPPLVFLQGVMGDGDIDWQALLRHLTGRFTCHLPSWRSRGLSGDHPDLSFGRLVDDVLDYVASIAEPTGLVGWSGGAGLALAVAAQSDAVDAVAAVEPLTPRLMEDQEQAALGDAVARMGELAAEGRFTDGVRAFAAFVFTDEEMSVAEGAGYFEAAGRYVPDLLNFFQQQVKYQGPTHEDTAVLGAISAPVLVLIGSDTKPYATAGARYVADHVPNARMQEIPDAGHAVPLTHPEALAEALTAFFSPAQRPA